MNFFLNYRTDGKLNQTFGNSVWRYGLRESDYKKLKDELTQSLPESIDSRDVFIYYACWWTFDYNGGSPSKQLILDSVGGQLQLRITAEQFYRKAIEGAKRLGIRWIQKQNTLYFRTLLLQGGLPIKHMIENQGVYLNFLYDVMEIQPETIEDFAFNHQVVNQLPPSSQNDVIYENCLALVKSILNGDNQFNEILKSRTELDEISRKLHLRKTEIQARERIRKPQIYWVLNKGKDDIVNNYTIKLHIGIPDLISTENLENLIGVTCIEQSYQLYINEILICVFRRTNNGKYKTDWYNHSSVYWDGSAEFVTAYTFIAGCKHNVTEIVQYTPILNTPILAVSINEDQYRILKSNFTSRKNAFLILPQNWNLSSPSHNNPESKTAVLNNINLALQEIQGSVTCVSQIDNQELTFYCEVGSFDWDILSYSPNWLNKASITIVNQCPQVNIYNEIGERIYDRPNVFYKQRDTLSDWTSLNPGENIATGYYNLKIIYNGIEAHTEFYNIGKLNFKYETKNIDEGKVTVENNNHIITIHDSAMYTVTNEHESYIINRLRESNKIPDHLNVSIKSNGKKSVQFKIKSPFSQTGIINNDGFVIKKNTRISIQDLSHHRILIKENTNAEITIKNKIKNDVIIHRILSINRLPLSTYIDDITRLFYLGDPMNFENVVLLELKTYNNSISIEITGFSYYLNIENRNDGFVTINEFQESTVEPPKLVAIPLNVPPEDIELIPLVFEDGKYMLPVNKITTDFIIISDEQQNAKLMPRFVSTNPEYIKSENQLERINRYYEALESHSLESPIWQEVMKYFEIAHTYKIPYTTFDQIRAIAGSSSVAAKTFLYLSTKVQSTNNSSITYINEIIPQIEQETAFCFHWISKADWVTAFENFTNYLNTLYSDLGIMDELNMRNFNLITSYFQHENLEGLGAYIMNDRAIKIEIPINNSDLLEIRSYLGERILNELPIHNPLTSQNYGIPIENHYQARLLINTPIAVGESICGRSNPAKSFWEITENAINIRRNMQYAKTLSNELYKKIITKTINAQL